MLENPSPCSGANHACRPCTSGDLKCWNGPLCKCWFQHWHEEDHPVVEQRQLPSDISTHLMRVVDILEDIRLLMRITSTDGQRDQSQPGDQRDNRHAAEEEDAKPTWEVLETASSAPSFHSCDVEPNASPGTMDTSSETTQKQDMLRWPHPASVQGVEGNVVDMA